jgi:hypothetical protein
MREGSQSFKQTADDPANAALRTIRTEAYMFLGDATLPSPNQKTWQRLKNMRSGAARATIISEASTTASTCAVAVSPRAKAQATK